MSVATNDRRSLVLMLSLLLFILLVPLLEDNRVGEVFLLILLYAVVITAVLELHGKTTLRWLAISAAIPVVLIELASLFRHLHWLSIAARGLFMAFLAAIEQPELYTYLGKPGSITRGRIHASVSLI